MYDPNSLDRNGLTTQLENYRLIVEVNTEMVDESLFAKEELVRNLALAENYIHESEQWEKSGDQAKAYDALRNADIIILEISSVINQMLNQGT